MSSEHWQTTFVLHWTPQSNCEEAWMRAGEAAMGRTLECVPVPNCLPPPSFSLGHLPGATAQRGTPRFQASPASHSTISKTEDKTIKNPSQQLEMSLTIQELWDAVYAIRALDEAVRGWICALEQLIERKMSWTTQELLDTEHEILATRAEHEENGKAIADLEQLLDAIERMPVAQDQAPPATSIDPVPPEAPAAPAARPDPASFGSSANHSASLPPPARGGDKARL